MYNPATGLAMVWDGVHGTRDLRAVLSANGLTNVIPGWALCHGIGVATDDGNVYFLGYGINPGSTLTGWWARVAKPLL